MERKAPVCAATGVAGQRRRIVRSNNFSRLLIFATGCVPAQPEKLPGDQAIIVAAIERQMDAMDEKNLQVEAAKGGPLYRQDAFAVKNRTKSSVIGLVLATRGSWSIFVAVARYKSRRRLG